MIYEISKNIISGIINHTIRKIRERKVRSNNIKIDDTQIEVESIHLYNFFLDSLFPDYQIIGGHIDIYNFQLDLKTKLQLSINILSKIKNILNNPICFKINQIDIDIVLIHKKILNSISSKLNNNEKTSISDNYTLNNNVNTDNEKFDDYLFEEDKTDDNANDKELIEIADNILEIFHNGNVKISNINVNLKIIDEYNDYNEDNNILINLTKKLLEYKKPGIDEYDINNYNYQYIFGEFTNNFDNLITKKYHLNFDEILLFNKYQNNLDLVENLKPKPFYDNLFISGYNYSKLLPSNSPFRHIYIENIEVIRILDINNGDIGHYYEEYENNSKLQTQERDERYEREEEILTFRSVVILLDNLKDSFSGLGLNISNTHPINSENVKKSQNTDDGNQNDPKTNLDMNINLGILVDYLWADINKITSSEFISTIYKIFTTSDIQSSGNIDDNSDNSIDENDNCIDNIYNFIMYCNLAKIENCYPNINGLLDSFYCHNLSNIQFGFNNIRILHQNFGLCDIFRTKIIKKDDDYHVSPLKINSYISDYNKQLEILIESITAFLNENIDDNNLNSDNTSQIDSDNTSQIDSYNTSQIDSDNITQINIICKEIMIITELFISGKGVLLSQKIDKFSINLNHRDVVSNNLLDYQLIKNIVKIGGYKLLLYETNINKKKNLIGKIKITSSDNPEYPAYPAIYIVKSNNNSNNPSNPNNPNNEGVKLDFFGKRKKIELNETSFYYKFINYWNNFYKNNNFFLQQNKFQINIGQFITDIPIKSLLYCYFFINKIKHIYTNLH